MMKTTYKYWLIYIIPGDIQEEFFPDDNPYIDTNHPKYLYGYTDEKKLIKLWKKQRSKDLFIIKEKEINRDDVNFLARIFPRGKLTLLEGDTRGEENIYHYKVPMTGMEYITISSNLAFYLSTLIYRKFKDHVFPGEVFNPIIKYALNVFCYDDVFYPNDPDYDVLSEYDYFKEFIHTYNKLLA